MGWESVRVGRMDCCLSRLIAGVGGGCLLLGLPMGSPVGCSTSWLIDGRLASTDGRVRDFNWADGGLGSVLAMVFKLCQFPGRKSLGVRSVLIVGMWC